MAPAFFVPGYGECDRNTNLRYVPQYQISIRMKNKVEL